MTTPIPATLRTGASTYAFSDADLTQIITKTQSAIESMQQLNQQVTSHTEALGSANRSDSGQLLQGNLATWMSDFNKTVNNLNDLNQKANGLLQVNRNTAANAAGQAR